MGVKVGKEITRFFSRRKNGDVTLVKQLAGDEMRNTGSTSYERGREDMHLPSSGTRAKSPSRITQAASHQTKEIVEGGGEGGRGGERGANELRIRSVFPCTAKKGTLRDRG